MKRILAIVVGLSLIVAPVTGYAGTLDQTLGKDARHRSVETDKLILKDPMIAGLMSASLPGLGQVYAGERGKGFLFFLGTVGSLGAAAAFAHPADLDLADYDKVEYGGNADGQMSLAELQNWEDGEFVDDAFGDLATGRKVGAITSVGVGLGLYIWNIIDARSSSRDYNRKVIQRRIDLGMTAGEDHAGLALNFRF